MGGKYGKKNNKRPPENGGLIELYLPTLKGLLIAIAAGTAYYIFMRITGLSIPCLFRMITGLYCPGCGVTHIFTDLFSLDFRSAVTENLAITVLAPVWLAVFIVYICRNRTTVFHRSQACNILSIVSLVILIVFGILRNIPGFEFLLPGYARG